VIDASVAVKWYLRDEPDLDAAGRILDGFRDGRTMPIAPQQLVYEVPSAIRNALRTQRQTVADARRGIGEFIRLKIPLIHNDELMAAGYDQAVRFGCSFYDGLYLALADQIGCPFIFADHRLRNALGVTVPRALWLTDYRAPA
jgi:predicted nucleic acid-binding protein